MMISKQNRMDDAEYTVKVPLCKTCRNCITREFDSSNSARPVLACRKLGEIPDDLYMCKIKECRSYHSDPVKTELYKDLI